MDERILLRRGMEDAGCGELHIRRAESLYDAMLRGSRYTDNKQLLLLPGATHTDLYDGGGKNAIPFDRLAAFFSQYLRNG